LPQIIRITSEALQATVRRLLPSQQGFGLDLEATNVVTPIIDLTPTAEGSALPEMLQTALSFDDLTTFSITGGSSTIVSTPGFWRVYAMLEVQHPAGSSVDNALSINNGLSTKDIISTISDNFGQDNTISTNIVDIVVLLTAGDSLVGSTTARNNLNGVVRQIADINGNLVNPSGYTSE